MVQAATELVFDFFYVMNDAMDPDSDGLRRKFAVLLMMVELGQMARLMSLQQFGWSDTSANAMAYPDVVWIFTNSVQQVLPRSLFYCIALFLVISLLAVTASAIRHLKLTIAVNKWHVRGWRWFYFSSSVVLLPSVVLWTLFPLECFVFEDTDGSWSWKDGECRPWDLPLSVASIISIVIVVVHVVLVLGASLFLFETHPLSRNPWAQSTGRVEMLWSVVKVMVVACAFLNQHVSSLVLSGAMLVLVSALVYLHYLILPFHDHVANVTRAAVYAALWWLSLGSVVASCYQDADASGYQTRQSALLGVTPLFFVIGIVAILSKQSTMMKYLHLLRGEKADKNNTGLTRRTSVSSAENGPGYNIYKTRKRRLSLADDGNRSVTSYTTARSELPRTNLDKFFDVDSEMSRAFQSGVKATTFARRLLHQREIDDVSYLSSLVTRGLKENPDSSELLVFQLQILRFIVGDGKAADSELARLQSLGLMTDLEFLLYSVARRTASDALVQAKAVPGESGVTTKLDEHLALAHAATLGSLNHIASFWKIVRRLQKRSNAGELTASVAEELVNKLESFDATFAKAELEFAWLLEKYPASVALLQECALFRDVCANDEKEAERLRTQAELLERGSGAEAEEDPARDDEDQRRSNATSDTERSRTMMVKFVLGWSHDVLGPELNGVYGLHRRVKIFVALLVAVATIGMLLSDQLLFNSMVKKDIELITQTGLLRTYTVTSNYISRSQLLAAHHNNTHEIEVAKHELFAEAETIRTGHLDKFEKLRWYQRDEYTTPDHEMLVPQAGQFAFRHEYMDYWTMGGDLARRIERIGKMDEAEILLGGYSEESKQGNLDAVYLFENSFRQILPTMEEIVELYEGMVRDFGRLTTALVAVNVVLNTLLCLGVALSVLHAVADLIQVVRYRYVCCLLALALPRESAKKLHRFYSDQANGIRQMEDEEAEKRAIEQSGGDDQAAGSDENRENEEADGHVADHSTLHGDEPSQLDERETDRGENKSEAATGTLPLVPSSPQLGSHRSDMSPKPMAWRKSEVFLNSEVLGRHKMLIEERERKENTPAVLQVWSETGEYPSSPSPLLDLSSSPGRTARVPQMWSSDMALPESKAGEEDGEAAHSVSGEHSHPGSRASSLEVSERQDASEQQGSARAEAEGEVEGRREGEEVKVMQGEEDEAVADGSGDSEWVEVPPKGAISAAVDTLKKQWGKPEEEAQEVGAMDGGGREAEDEDEDEDDGDDALGFMAEIVLARSMVEREREAGRVGQRGARKPQERHAILDSSDSEEEEGGRGGKRAVVTGRHFGSTVDEERAREGQEEADQGRGGEVLSGKVARRGRGVEDLQRIPRAASYEQPGAGVWESGRQAARRVQGVQAMTEEDKDELLAQLLAERDAKDARAWRRERVQERSAAAMTRVISSGSEGEAGVSKFEGESPPRSPTMSAMKHPNSPRNKGQDKRKITFDGKLSSKIETPLVHEIEEVPDVKEVKEVKEVKGEGTTVKEVAEMSHAKEGLDQKKEQEQEQEQELEHEHESSGDVSPMPGAGAIETSGEVGVESQRVADAKMEEEGRKKVTVRSQSGSDEDEEAAQQRRAKEQERAGRVDAEEEEAVPGRCKLQPITEHQTKALKAALASTQRWADSVWVYGLVFVVMLALCVLSILFPARFISLLVNLGPTTNAAGRRQYLARACVHFARELVLDDGFTRMTHAEVHGALAWHLTELRRVSAAVRLGDDDLGITQGADFRNREHNTIMYEPGCPWRNDGTNCSLPGLPDVEVDGLYSLILHFYEALGAVMSQYGVEPSEAAAAYQALVDRTEDPTEFPEVRLSEERYRMLDSDPNMRLIIQSFDGDLFQGFDAVVSAFFHETEASLDTVHVELRLLFAIYIVSVVGVFYLLLFRRTLGGSLQEVERTRQFVLRMPCHALDRKEVSLMHAFFRSSAFRLPGAGTWPCAKAMARKREEDQDDSGHWVRSPKAAKEG